MTRRRFALCLAAIIAILGAITDHAARRIYPAWPGIQPFLAPCIGVVDTIRWPVLLPFSLAARGSSNPIWLIISPPWVVGAYFLIGLGLHRAWIWLQQPSDAPVHSARRALLGRGIGVITGAAGAVGGYALLAEPRKIELTRRVIRLPGLPPQLTGLTAVQLTDLHYGDWVPASFLRRAVEMANDVKPDLFFLTGDYATKPGRRRLRPVMEMLSGLRPRIGTFAVLGNHDHRCDSALLRRLMGDLGFHLIDNSRRFIGLDRSISAEPHDGFCIAGIGDWYCAHQDYPAALGNLPAGMPRILLSHNPDVAEDDRLTSSGLRVDLIISGHTHGGQIRLPLLGTPVVPSGYGQKYASGLVTGPVCPVFISRGLGLAVLPLRWGVPPEIAVLEFHPSPGP